MTRNPSIFALLNENDSGALQLPRSWCLPVPHHHMGDFCSGKRGSQGFLRSQHTVARTVTYLVVITKAPLASRALSSNPVTFSCSFPNVHSQQGSKMPLGVSPSKHGRIGAGPHPRPASTPRPRSPATAQSQWSLPASHRPGRPPHSAPMRRKPGLQTSAAAWLPDLSAGTVAAAGPLQTRPRAHPQPPNRRPRGAGPVSCGHATILLVL